MNAVTVTRPRGGPAARPLAPLAVAAALLALCAPPLAADLLILRDGTEVLGTLERLDGEALVLRTEEGARRGVARDEVAKLEVHRDLSGTFVRRVEGLADPLLHEVLGLVADREAYPSAGAVNLYLGVTVTFEADGSMHRTVRNVVRVLQERGKDEGTVPVTWMRDVDALRFEHGRTYLPDGEDGAPGSVRGLTDKGVRVAPAYGQLPEYDRMLHAVHTLPSVDVGVVVDWQYTESRAATDPFMPAWFHDTLHLDEPVLQGEVRVRVHRDLDHVVRLSGRRGVVEERLQEGPYRVHVFSYRGRSPARKEGHRPPSHELHPTVYVAPRADWTEVSRQALPAFRVPEEAGPRAREVLDAQLAGATDPAAVQQALALWVAREVRLVRVPMVRFGYRPRPLEEILATRTGNYLDKSYALHALYALAGLESELYLVRDRHAGAMPEGVPTLGHFDDAVVRVRLGGGEWIFCDADEVDLGPRDVPAVFYGAPALRVTGEVPAPGLIEIPAPPPEVDLLHTRYENRMLPDGTLVGARSLTVRGNSARVVRSYRNLSREDLTKRMEKLNHRFHPSAVLEGFELRNLGDFTEDVFYQRRYRVPGYALRAGERLMAFRIPGLDDSMASATEPVRRHPLAFTDRALHEQEVTVELPPGFRVIHHPPGLDLRGEGWSYRSELAVVGGELRFTYRYLRDAFRVAPEDYPDYRRMRRERASEARAWVVIEREETP